MIRHPDATAFHQRGWIQALATTYGYRPLVLTTAQVGEPLVDGLVLCEVSSRLTGRRMVSLPFTDHIAPLFSERYGAQPCLDWLRSECELRGWKYVELRPPGPLGDESRTFTAGAAYCRHELDLRADIPSLFRALHKDCIQRKIRRAEREELSCETGRSKSLLNEFYRLVIITRKRHRLLPQPRAWFRNLMSSMGDAAQIRIARKEDLPIAGMLTLRQGRNLIYKYGCSDARFHHLGAMPFLFWEMIQEGKATGAERLDLGRTDFENEGLMTFKERLGATRKHLTYYRYSHLTDKRQKTGVGERMARRIFASLPEAVSSWGGKAIYRHLG